MVKVFIVEEGHKEIYGRIFEKRFKELGFSVESFYIYPYLKEIYYFNEIKKRDFLSWFLRKIQNKYLWGPLIKRINDDFYKSVLKFKPDLLFLYRPTHIYSGTLYKIKKELKNLVIFNYNNDDPFSNFHKKLIWRHYFTSLKFSNFLFVYRKKNILDLQKLGFYNVDLLRSYYIREKNFYISDIKDNKYKCDVVFIGHYEEDERDEYLKFLLDYGINLKIYGPFWNKSKHYKYFCNKLGYDISTYVGKDYNLAINSAKIALVFLSKLNNDTYTRRCFEIPATKTMMMAEYTNDLANNLFEENKEAVYFRNKKELLQKIKFYLQNEDKIKEIGENGYKRLIKDGHEAIDRCKKVIDVYNKFFV